MTQEKASSKSKWMLTQPLHSISRGILIEYKCVSISKTISHISNIKAAMFIPLYPVYVCRVQWWLFGFGNWEDISTIDTKEGCM